MRSETPESVLELVTYQPLSPHGKESLKTLCQQYYTAAKCRFPQMVELYLTLDSADGRGVVTRLCQDVIQDDKEKFQFSSEIMSDFMTLYKAGVSLSWWLFGIGRQIHIDPSFEPCAPSLPLQDAISMMCYKQGWSKLDGFWFITQTHPTSEKLTHRILTRLMTALPLVKLFPTMPSVLNMYKRLQKIGKNFSPAIESEAWMRDCSTILRRSSTYAAALLLVQYSTIVNWREHRGRPNKKIQRLSYLISILLELYGEHDGFEFYLRVLNEEAKAQGFLNLTEVLMSRGWKYPLAEEYDEDEDEEKAV